MRSNRQRSHIGRSQPMPYLLGDALSLIADRETADFTRADMERWSQKQQIAMVKVCLKGQEMNSSASR